MRRRRIVLVAVAVSTVVCAGCGEMARSSSTATSTSTSTTTTSTTSLTSTTTTVPATTGAVEELGVKVLASRPHDPTAFTEGLLFDAAGVLYESTGQYGESTVRRLDLDTGSVVDSTALDPSEFGEGLAVVPGGLLQLTWKEHRAIRWNTALERGTEVGYDGEGWGLAGDDDGSRLVMSNGSSTLTFRDPTTFAAVGTVGVRLDGEPVTNLNELELVGGSVFANVWMTDRIMRIDPTSGAVTGVIDASGLLDATQRRDADVLNGIAHRPGDPDDVLWITGKYWPTMFQVQLVPA